MNKHTKDLLKENDQLSKGLDPNYNKVLTNIVFYIRGTNISEYHQELIRRDITHMLLEGALRGDPIQSIIGDDLKTFCDNVLAEIPSMKTKQRIIAVIRNTCLCFAVLSIIWFCSGVIDLFSGKINYPFFPVTVGNLVCSILIIFFSTIFFAAITKNSFKKSLINIKLYLISTACFSLLIFLNIFLREILLEVHAFVAVLAILVLFVAYKLLNQKI